MSKTISALTVGAASLLMLCLGGQFGVAAEKGTAVAVVQQWRGFNASQEAPRRVVVKDQKAWEEVWSAMVGYLEPKPEAPKVDFDSQMVIAVFMGRRSTGGFSIQITGIELNDKMVVAVKQSSPPPGAITTQALTSPYHVVVVAKTDKPVEFVDDKK
ncbi:MAG: protease complex subunit PrcB family protein [Planctomycetaceae bacterium]|nr:protease complex subunit PrcB family protein [Planctomycetaceae bacterium]